MKTVNLPKYQAEIRGYCERVNNAFHPDCIILHGSLARGNFTSTSDVDLVVIGGTLPDNFFQRLFELNRLRDGKTPLEVMGYTLSEWEQMMANRHLTTLEVLQWGIPLMGHQLFRQWRVQLDDWKSQGLRRDKNSWVIPRTFH